MFRKKNKSSSPTCTPEDRHSNGKKGGYRWSLRWRPSLSRLLEKEDFSQIREILNNHCQCAQSRSDKNDASIWVSECTDFTGQTALHILLKFRPPLDIVEMVIETLSQSNMLPEQQPDTFGQTPLHVAAGWGAGSAICGCFLKGSSTKKNFLAKQKDSSGRTALHLATMNPKGLFPVDPGLEVEFEKNEKYLDSSFMEEQEHDMAQVVKMLLQADPFGISVCDCDGQTPMDYAKSRRAPLVMMQALQDQSYMKSSSSKRIGSSNQKLLLQSNKKCSSASQLQTKKFSTISNSNKGIVRDENNKSCTPTTDQDDIVKFEKLLSGVRLLDAGTASPSSSKNRKIVDRVPIEIRFGEVATVMEDDNISDL